MKKLLLILLALQSLWVYSQSTQDYYVVVKSGYSLDTQSRTTNPNQTLNLSFQNNNFDAFYNNKPIYYFEKAFPTAISPYLQRVYRVTLDNGNHINDFISREEIEYVELTYEGTILLNPNDYSDLDGNPLSQLDLIKAPLAWNITTGNPSVIVGMVDHYVDINHEDLVNEILQTFDDNGIIQTHGTKVAGMITAETDNTIGISSIGFNTKLINRANSLSANEVLLLSQTPNVKIINCSWHSGTCTFSSVDALVYEEIWNSGVTLFFAAGNGTTCGEPNNYVYPAAYDHTIAVSAVGHLYPIGTNDPVLGISNWKDVHERVIGDPTSTAQHNDKVDICAPGYNITTTRNNNSYGVSAVNSAGTSLSSPMVAGVAALMLSVNPNLTPDEVRDILKNTADDIYQIPENAPYQGLLGTGRVNAYRAVLTAQCLANPSTGLDLAMQNSELDDGTEPDNETQHPWTSKDIWVRNQDDGNFNDNHQNPEYHPSDPNYVYVRVTNNSCETSTGNDQLKLYWSKANTSLAWPQHWDGSLFINDPVTGQDILMGDEIGTLSIPQIEIGETKILKFQWNVPDPEDYQNINPNPWHFCLLSRIVSADDPMTFAEGNSITTNVLNNNNIAWKNTTVVDIEPNGITGVGGVIAVGNPSTTHRTFKLELVKEQNELGKALYDEAEVSLTMDNIIYSAWDNGGKSKSNFKNTKTNERKIVTANNAILDNIQLAPNEIGTINLKFNFLTKENTSKTEYTYHVIQRDAVTDEIIGGETYIVRKKIRETFTADGGNDKEIDKNDSTTLTASDINEDATYNWYDTDGNLIYTGTDLTVSPLLTKTYKLEVISNLDGYKDYDEIQVKVNPYKLESLIPNPATSQVTANYIADDANSAYLMVVNTNNGSSNNYILDTTSYSITLDVSGYTAGIYEVILVANGVSQTSQTLIKQ